MEKQEIIYSVTGLKRNDEKKWTIFEHVTSLEKIATVLIADNFDYAVIYDKDKKYKLGAWSREKGIFLHKNKRKVQE